MRRSIWCCYQSLYIDVCQVLQPQQNLQEVVPGPWCRMIPYSRDGGFVALPLSLALQCLSLIHDCKYPGRVLTVSKEICLYLSRRSLNRMSQFSLPPGVNSDVDPNCDSDDPDVHYEEAPEICWPRQPTIPLQYPDVSQSPEGSTHRSNTK